MIENSRRIAGLVGPTLIVLMLSENVLVNPHLYDRQIPPLVYLSGTLLFIAGLAIVRVHNAWCRGWPVFVTLIGWLGMVLGLLRMFAPGGYSEGYRTHSGAFYVLEAVLLVIGILLTYRAYARPNRS